MIVRAVTAGPVLRGRLRYHRWGLPERKVAFAARAVTHLTNGARHEKKGTTQMPGRWIGRRSAVLRREQKRDPFLCSR